MTDGRPVAGVQLASAHVRCNLFQAFQQTRADKMIPGQFDELYRHRGALLARPQQPRNDIRAVELDAVVAVSCLRG